MQALADRLLSSRHSPRRCVDLGSHFEVCVCLRFTAPSQLLFGTSHASWCGTDERFWHAACALAAVCRTTATGSRFNTPTAHPNGVVAGDNLAKQQGVQGQAQA